MKELLTYIAQNLVEHPESVVVTEYESAGETVLVPACYGAYVVEPLSPGETRVVKTTL